MTLFYAYILNIIFVTFFYSSGIPLLLLFGMASLLLQFYCYKYILLTFAKRPPNYDHRLNKEVVNLLPYALIMHMLVSLYMYSQPLIFP